MEPRTTTPRGYTWEQREQLWKWHREGVPRRTIAKRLGRVPPHTYLPRLTAADSSTYPPST